MANRKRPGAAFLVEELGGAAHHKDPYVPHGSWREEALGVRPQSALLGSTSVPWVLVTCRGLVDGKVVPRCALLAHTGDACSE